MALQLRRFLTNNCSSLPSTIRLFPSAGFSSCRVLCPTSFAFVGKFRNPTQHSIAINPTFGVDFRWRGTDVDFRSPASFRLRSLYHDLAGRRLFSSWSKQNQKLKAQAQSRADSGIVRSGAKKDAKAAVSPGGAKASAGNTQTQATVATSSSGKSAAAASANNSVGKTTNVVGGERKVSSAGLKSKASSFKKSDSRTKKPVNGNPQSENLVSASKKEGSSVAKKNEKKKINKFKGSKKSPVATTAISGAVKHVNSSREATLATSSARKGAVSANKSVGEITCIASSENKVSADVSKSLASSFRKIDSSTKKPVNVSLQSKNLVATSKKEDSVEANSIAAVKSHNNKKQSNTSKGSKKEDSVEASSLAAVKSHNKKKHNNTSKGSKKSPVAMSALFGAKSKASSIRKSGSSTKKPVNVSLQSKNLVATSKREDSVEANSSAAVKSHNKKQSNTSKGTKKEGSVEVNSRADVKSHNKKQSNTSKGAKKEGSVEANSRAPVKSHNTKKQSNTSKGSKKPVAISALFGAKKRANSSRESNKAAIVTGSSTTLDQKLTNQGGNVGELRFKPLYPPSGKSVVVVESPTKAKVIQKYLGESYEVLPSCGHVRDLAGKSRSVRPDDDFSMVWEVPASAWTHLKGIKVALIGAENLILASDPDREGEAIAWHVTEMLKQQDALNGSIKVARVVFHEITESAIKNALKKPRSIDSNLVNSYLARRALDYLIGFNISPLLWRKLPGCQSAGRVQSAALSLICDRETEIEHFKPKEYWTIQAEFQHTESAKNSCFISSQLTHFGSKKVDQFSICSNVEAEGIQNQASSSKFKVTNVKESQSSRTSPIPYITSTLQQDSSKRLNFSASYTMKLAQKLYEGVKLSDEEATGLITYMRTDGLHISEAAAADIRSLVMERYGNGFASKSVRRYFKNVKNAQEAHEAIRPTNIRRLPSSLVGILDEDSLKLYSLIWTRTMACQMESSMREMIQVDIGNMKGGMIFRSTDSKVGFLGYLAVYQDKEAINCEVHDEEENVSGSAFDHLRRLKVNDQLKLNNVDLSQHFTKPPGRYSEGSLVKKLEELGIGRPSTYASTIKVLKDRNYMTMKSRVLYPEFRGRMVSTFLSHHFTEVADYGFTADMENELDNVSTGATDWKVLLRDYWSRFSKHCELSSKVDVRQVEKMLEEKFGHILFASLPSDSRVCPSCAEGTLSLKVSRFGAGYFVGCDKHPKCKYIARTIFVEESEAPQEEEAPPKSFPARLLGHHPDSNEQVFLKHGPYGHYVQLGEDRPGHAPKRASLHEIKDNIESVTLEIALELLKYPLTLGNHPQDDRPVILSHSRGRFLVRHRRTTAPVSKQFDPKKLTMEDALKCLCSKDAKHLGRPKRSAAKAKSKA